MARCGVLAGQYSLLGVALLQTRGTSDNDHELAMYAKDTPSRAYSGSLARLHRRRQRRFGASATGAAR